MVLIFRRFFERIMQECFETGLVRGKELYFDATKLEANASLDSMATRLVVEDRFQEHLAGVFPKDAWTDEKGANAPEVAVLGSPPVGKGRRTRGGTAGSRRPDANSGRWFGRVTGGSWTSE